VKIDTKQVCHINSIVTHQELAWLIIMDSGFDVWIYWTIHTLNSFLITNLSLYLFWFSGCSLLPRLLCRILPLDSVSWPEIASCGPNIEPPVGQLIPLLFSVTTKRMLILCCGNNSLPSRCLATDDSIVLL
jgi:hypothetical protein